MIKNKNVVVTGGAGFLGRHVCEELQKYNPASVFVVRSKEYDLREKQDIVRLLDKSKPDIVIHLAAVVGGIGANKENPGRFFYENAIMGIQLIEAARVAGVDKIVSVGTICSYPKFATTPFVEEELWDGYPEETNAPYGLAKKMLLVQSQAYKQQYNFNAVTLLPANLYGPWDNFDPSSSHVIPALIRKVLEAQAENRSEIEAWGTGSATREFLHVQDAARGIVLATENYNESDPVNLGTGREISIKALLEMICDVCEFDGKINWNVNQPDGQPRRVLNTEKAKSFGFEAQIALLDGIRETVTWYKEQL